MAEKLLCGTCKRRIANKEGSVILKCPSCGKGDIVRCYHCREISAKYKCDQCGFEGPN
ncbi:MAG: zinc finger domain-containing protein [Candidatus Woesearchaeota archaeon]|nr:zinc finger domain-containing protein [Candidatus Woesearchaeota archaeon]